MFWLTKRIEKLYHKKNAECDKKHSTFYLNRILFGFYFKLCIELW